MTEAGGKLRARLALPYRRTPALVRSRRNAICPAWSSAAPSPARCEPIPAFLLILACAIASARPWNIRQRVEHRGAHQGRFHSPRCFSEARVRRKGPGAHGAELAGLTELTELTGADGGRRAQEAASGDWCGSAARLSDGSRRGRKATTTGMEESRERPRDGAKGREGKKEVKGRKSLKKVLQYG